jgi:hypothetical protein
MTATLVLLTGSVIAFGLGLAVDCLLGRWK